MQNVCLIEYQRDLQRGCVVPLEARLAVQIPESEADSLFRWLTENEFNWDSENEADESDRKPRKPVRMPDPSKIGWDIKTRYGGEGYYLYTDALECCPKYQEAAKGCFAALRGLETFASEAAEKMLADGWSSFDREYKATDILLVDIADEARAFGWQPGEVLAAELDRLMDLSDSIIEKEKEVAWLKELLLLACAKKKPDPLAPPPDLAERISMFTRTDLDWADVDVYSTPVPGNSDNVPVLLRRLNVALRFNAWLERVEISKDDGESWASLTDQHFDWMMTKAANYDNRFRPAEGFMRRALSTIAHDNEVDPAIDRLAELERDWDGTPRLATWLTEACGTPGDAYHAAVAAVTIGGMVRRVRHPGCKLDLMPVFVSEKQGHGKSTLAEIIALDSSWFTDNVTLGMETKELLPLLRGKAIVEIAEMRTRGEVEAAKAMISRRTDSARVAYGREPIDRPRRNIFLGTTNDAQMLEDTTGGRRFLPVTVIGEIRLDWLRENIAQIVGEACVLESKGTTFDLPREVWAIAGEHQEAARAKADYEVILDELFAREHGSLLISCADLVVRMRNAIGRSVSPKLLARAMRALGFANATQRLNNVPTKVWRRGDAETAQRVGNIMVPMLPPALPRVTDNE